MDAIKTQLDEFHDNHVGETATPEYTEANDELQVALEDGDIEAVEQALSDFVDAAREMGSSLGVTNMLGAAMQGDVSDSVKQDQAADIDLAGDRADAPSAAQLEAQSWEADLDQLASHGLESDRPSLSDDAPSMDLDEDSAAGLAL